MSEQVSTRTDAAAVAATIAMYEEIPGTLGGHFDGFRSLEGIHPALHDMQVSHRVARVPLGESNFVEVGPGNGRDAVGAFVEHSRIYTGIGPAQGELDVAREKVHDRFPDISAEELERMFQKGFAQSADYPEDVDVVHSVNGFTVHTPFGELPDAFDRIGESLRPGGAVHILTKAAVKNLVEFNPNESFAGAEGMTPRTFYIPGRVTLLEAMRKAGLTVVPEAQELVPVPSKEWDWFTAVAVKS